MALVLPHFVFAPDSICWVLFGVFSPLFCGFFFSDWEHLLPFLLSAAAGIHLFTFSSMLFKWILFCSKDQLAEVLGKTGIYLTITKLRILESKWGLSLYFSFPCAVGLLI